MFALRALSLALFLTFAVPGLAARARIEKLISSRSEEIKIAFKEGAHVNATEYAMAVLAEAQADGQLHETRGCNHLQDKGMMAAQCSMLLNAMNWKMMCGMPPYNSCFKTCCSFRGGEGSPQPEVCQNMNFHGVLCKEIINKFNKDEACFQNSGPQWLIEGAQDLRNACPVQCETITGQSYMNMACGSYISPLTKGAMCGKSDFAEACTGLCCQDDY